MTEHGIKGAHFTIEKGDRRHIQLFNFQGWIDGEMWRIGDSFSTTMMVPRTLSEHIIRDLDIKRRDGIDFAVSDIVVASDYAVYLYLEGVLQEHHFETAMSATYHPRPWVMGGNDIEVIKIPSITFGEHTHTLIIADEADVFLDFLIIDADGYPIA